MGGKPSVTFHRGGIASLSGASAKAGKRLGNPSVAKLADAHDSGSCGVTPVLVQLQSLGHKVERNPGCMVTSPGSSGVSPVRLYSCQTVETRYTLRHGHDRRKNILRPRCSRKTGTVPRHRV